MDAVADGLDDGAIAVEPARSVMMKLMVLIATPSPGQMVCCENRSRNACIVVARLAIKISRRQLGSSTIKVPLVHAIGQVSQVHFQCFRHSATGVEQVPP